MQNRNILRMVKKITEKRKEGQKRRVQRLPQTFFAQEAVHLVSEASLHARVEICHSNMDDTIVICKLNVLLYPRDGTSKKFWVIFLLTLYSGLQNMSKFRVTY